MNKVLKMISSEGFEDMRAGKVIWMPSISSGMLFVMIRGLAVDQISVGRVHLKKKVLVSFYGPTVGAMFINVDRIPTFSFTSSHFNEPPSKGFEKRWKRLTFPNSLQNLICIISYCKCI